MQQENKYEKVPNSMYPKVRQQVVDRIETFGDQWMRLKQFMFLELV